jgi:hypothetical protein
VVFGTVLLDRGILTSILGRPLLLCSCSARVRPAGGPGAPRRALGTSVSVERTALARRAGRRRTFLAMGLTALGAFALVARATGWETVAMIVLLGCAAGLTVLDPQRPIARRRSGSRVRSRWASSRSRGSSGLVDAVTTSSEV